MDHTGQIRAASEGIGPSLSTANTQSDIPDQTNHHVNHPWLKFAIRPVWATALCLGRLLEGYFWGRWFWPAHHPWSPCWLLGHETCGHSFSHTFPKPAERQGGWRSCSGGQYVSKEASIILGEDRFHVCSPLVPASLLCNSCCCRVSSSGPALHLLAWGERRDRKTPLNSVIFSAPFYQMLVNPSTVLDKKKHSVIHLFLSSVCVTHIDASTLAGRKTAKEKESIKNIYHFQKMTILIRISGWNLDWTLRRQELLCPVELKPFSLRVSVAWKDNGSLYVCVCVCMCRH